MKTTIELSDAVLAEARRVAKRERTTVRALVEAALRQFLAQRRSTRKPFKLRRASFKGKGLQPEFEDASWERIRDAIYEGRGS